MLDSSQNQNALKCRQTNRPFHSRTDQGKMRHSQESKLSKTRSLKQLIAQSAVRFFLFPVLLGVVSDLLCFCLRFLLGDSISAASSACG